MLSTNFNDKVLHVGDTVRVKYTIKEGDKTRIQAFEGILIALRGRGENKTFTLRRIGDRGVGIERIWPLNARTLTEIDVVKQPKKIRRSKLYYLRELSGKSATRI